MARRKCYQAIPREGMLSFMVTSIGGGGGPRSALSRRVAAALAVALIGWAPGQAQAHGGAAEVVFATLVLVTPNVGSEFAFGGEPDPQLSLLLSWPVQVSLDGSLFEGTPGVHRLVLTPEITVGQGTAFRGRVGYRWLHRPIFLGLGLSESHPLGPCISPELGYRFWEADGPNVYVLGRSEVALSPGRPERWSISVSIGFAFL